jgi:hypothetical protein
MEGGVSWTIGLGWPWTTILLISASQVAVITGVSHQCPARLLYTPRKVSLCVWWDLLTVQYILNLPLHGTPTASTRSPGTTVAVVHQGCGQPTSWPGTRQVEDPLGSWCSTGGSTGSGGSLASHLNAPPPWACTARHVPAHLGSRCCLGAVVSSWCRQRGSRLWSKWGEVGNAVPMFTACVS